MRLMRLQLWVVIATLSVTSFVNAQGVQLPGIGPVNRSMGGATAGAAIDPIGSLHWNPATISGLESNELSFGLELISPIAKMHSTIPADTFGMGAPAATLHGSDETDSGWTGLPSLGLVMRQPESPVTLGVGVYGVAGYGLSYGSSTTNPISFPQTPTPETPLPGFGRIHSDVQLMQMTAVASYQVNPQLSLAVGPTMMLARLTAIPFPFAVPDDANMDGFATYPDGDASHFYWGGGFQVGAFFQAPNEWNFGLSYKSKNWFETLYYRSTDELGLPRDFKIELEYPDIISLGSSYTGFERFVLAADVRWTNFQDTATFGEGPRFDPATGRLMGLGWKSVWSTAVGMQYDVTDAVIFRTGYSYAESPVTNATAGFNVAAPVVLRHSINAGTTLKVSPNLQVHATYHHIFESDVSGPFQTPGGPVPGTNVTYSVGANAISVGVSSLF